MQQKEPYFEQKHRKDNENGGIFEIPPYFYGFFLTEFIRPFRN